jgi:hypothetical protein
LLLSNACRHQALIDVWSPAETEVPWFRTRVVCAKCGGRGNKIDVRPNWKTPQIAAAASCDSEVIHRAVKTNASSSRRPE